MSSSILIKNATVFDGSGSMPAIEDVSVQGGRVFKRGAGLDVQPDDHVIDGTGLWLMPGLLDIHTHYDLEIELDAGLSESVRHGTTTVVIGNCSLGTTFGAQRRNGEDPVSDVFARVENIPKALLAKVVDKIDWHDTAGYLKHLASRPLGPNVVPLLPHSMLRIEVMGTAAAVSRAPTREELARMCDLLERAMDQGYPGFSTDIIPFHYLANEPHTDKRIPSNITKFGELKALLKVVRQRDRIWQTTPDVSNKWATLVNFAFTSGRLFGKALKTSALTAIDLAHARNTWKLFPVLSGLLNSWLFKGKLHFQVLATPFRLFAEGAICPIFEEFESTRKVLACDISDAAGRLRVMDTAEFGQDFLREWHDPRAVTTFNRDLEALQIERCPVAEWCGENFAAVYRRIKSYQSGDLSVARSPDEAAALAAIAPIGSEGEFLLHLFRTYDRDLRWWFTVGNDRPEIMKKLLFHRHMLPGFNDSGAHLINLAFFDGNLVTLQLAQQESISHVARAVSRLTREPAAFFNVDAGSMEIGAQADLVLIDPEALRHYDSDKGRQFVHRACLGEQQLVNRSDGVVKHVLIAGEPVWDGREALPALGTIRLGRPLVARDAEPIKIAA